MGCHVIGVDASAPQVDAARKTRLGRPCDEREALDFDSEFDAVFSNAALHWMSNPAKVIAGVASCTQAARTFRRRIRRHGCVAKIRKALVEALNRRDINGEAASPCISPPSKTIQNN